MKKFLSATVAVMIGLFFTGCEKKLINSTPSVITSVESNVTIEKENKSYGCYLIHTPEGINTVRFTSPETLEGLTFLWENGKYKVEMKDLSGEYNLSPWMENSNIAVIMKILDSLNDTDSLKSVSKDESGEIFKGIAENIEYEIKLSPKNNIISIFVPKTGVKANFAENG